MGGLGVKVTAVPCLCVWSMVVPLTQASILNPIEAQRASAVLEETVERLVFLGR